MVKIVATNTGMSFLVDLEDFQYFNQWPWRESNSGYLQRGGSCGLFMLGAEIMKRAGLYEEGKYVDHKNRDKFDYRKKNLRMATPGESAANRVKPAGISDYRGVVPSRGKYMARIKNLFLGRFETVEEAAKAYDRAAQRLFGEFAVLNFPEEQHA